MEKAKKALLVCPPTPDSFWCGKTIWKYLNPEIQAPMPPLGLLTIAPWCSERGYEVELIDMNVSLLGDAGIKWEDLKKAVEEADIVLISAMIAQAPSLGKVIAICNKLKKSVVVGGPYVTEYADVVKGMGATSVMIGEAEHGIFSQLLDDWEAGDLKKSYQYLGYPDITQSPTPSFYLLEKTIEFYLKLAINFSLGCPHGCEFCTVPKMFGKIPRTKTIKQVLTEFDALYELYKKHKGSHGKKWSIFFVDDNFIGNRKAVEELLPEIIAWQEKRGYPFSFFTEASINLASMDNVLEMMVKAGFTTVFIGIESPNKDTLKKAHKNQNVGIDLLQAIKTIRGTGLKVNISFIVGLDGDGIEVFKAIFEFAYQADTPVVMAGLLGVMRGSPLWYRYELEGRLRGDVMTGSNTDVAALNFIPELISEEELIEGYKWLIGALYEPTLDNYFQRCWGMLKQLKIGRHRSRSKISLRQSIKILWRSLIYQGFSKEQGPAYRKFLLKVILHCPRNISLALALAIMGDHLQSYTASVLRMKDV